jgi:hypothetical protein
LFWFTAVIVCGVSSTRGALLAAALYVGIPYLSGQDVQSAVGLFGIGAVALGRLPGGVVGQLARVRAAVVVRARELETPESSRPGDTTLVPSALARRLLGTDR